MTGENLDDIMREGGVVPPGMEGEGSQPPPGEAPQPPKEGELLPPRKDRLRMPCGMAWNGGCGVSAWAAEMEELKADPAEVALASEHLAEILDAIMPEHWLQEMAKDSKIARILGSGAVLYALIQQKINLYQAIKEQREKEAAKDEESKSETTE